MKKNKKIKDNLDLRITKAIVFVVFVLYSFSLIFPFLWMLNNTFKTQIEFVKNPWSVDFDFSDFFNNFKTALTMEKGKSSIMDMILRSVLLTIAGTFLSLFSASTISYVVAKYKFKGRNFIYTLAILIMIVPTIGSTAATYTLLNDTGLYDNYLGILLLYSGGFGFQFLLLYGTFKGISWTYAESAMMDGASDFRTFISIMIPMAMPAIVPLAILDVIGFWNDYFTPYMYLRDKPTLAVGLQLMTSQMEYNANWPGLFALMIIAIVPIFIIFICFQKQIMANVTTGGLKG